MMRLNVHLDFGSMGDPILMGQLGLDRAGRKSVFEWDRGFAGHPLPV
jgi:hypothetical protein